MKKLFLVCAFVSTFTSNAFAIAVMGGGMCRGEACGTIAGCSQDIQEGTLKSTNAALNEMTSTTDFSKKSVFVAKIKEIQNLPTKKQTQAYFSIAGVESEKDIAEFIGEEQVPARFVESLEANMDLTRAEAESVVSVIRKAILGTRE